MVDDNNISVFNKFVAEALSELYSKFPRQVDFMLEEFDYLNNETNSDIFFHQLTFSKKKILSRLNNKFMVASLAWF